MQLIEKIDTKGQEEVKKVFEWLHLEALFKLSMRSKIPFPLTPDYLTTPEIFLGKQVIERAKSNVFSSMIIFHSF